MPNVDELRRAIEDPGPRPDIHFEIMARHRREWPTLWAAIDRLLLGTSTTVDELRRAIEDAGPRPDIHFEIMARHRREWPTLWAAIDRLLGTPTTLPPAPPPSPAPRSVPPGPGPGCNPNYTPCVPNDPVDVDCAGGSGDGPSYVTGPVRVTGVDVYDLDRDGDGTGCDT
jgi:hypothetical protein